LELLLFGTLLELLIGSGGDSTLELWAIDRGGGSMGGCSILEELLSSIGCGGGSMFGVQEKIAQSNTAMAQAKVELILILHTANTIKIGLIIIL
jgi:hypothetical protein